MKTRMPEVISLESAHEHATGPVDTPVTLLEYGDYECPRSGEAYRIVKRLRAQEPRMRLAFRHLPSTEEHPHAMNAALAAEAAGNQGRFWEMHDMLFEHQTALDPGSLASYAATLGLDLQQFAQDIISPDTKRRIQIDFSSGLRSGVSGTPAFFVNGRRFDHWHELETFLAVVTSALSAETQ